MRRRTGTMIIIQRCVEGLLVTADKRSVVQHSSIEDVVDDTFVKIRLPGINFGFCTAGTTELFDLKSGDVKFSVEGCLLSYLKGRDSFVTSDIPDLNNHLVTYFEEFLVNTPQKSWPEVRREDDPPSLFKIVLFYFDERPRINQFEMVYDGSSSIGIADHELVTGLSCVGGQRTMRRLIEGDDKEFDPYRNELGIPRVNSGPTRSVTECTAFARRLIEIASEHEYPNGKSTISPTSDGVLLTNDGRLERNFLP